MFDLVIFDCDGTLVDSEVFNNNVTSDVLTELGLNEYTRAACLDFFQGRSWNEIKPLLKDRHGDSIPDNIVEIYVQRVHEGIPDHVTQIPGAADLVESTFKIAKACVASNGERNNVLYTIESTGLSPYFSPDIIFTKNQVKNAKPHPDLFLYAAEQMGCKADRTLVIEDSVTGVQAGVAANMTVLGFSGSAHNPAAAEKILLESGASLVFDDLIHIQDWLKSQIALKKQA